MQPKSFLLLILPLLLMQPALREYSRTQDAFSGVGEGDSRFSLQKIITGRMYPEALCATSQGQVFISSPAIHLISVFDRNFAPKTQFSDSIRLADYEYSAFTGMYAGEVCRIVGSPDGKYIWAANRQMHGSGFTHLPVGNCQGGKSDESFLYKINTRTFVTEEIVRTGSEPATLAISPDGRWVLAGNRCSEDLSMVETGLTVEAHRIRLGSAPLDISIDPYSRNAYLTLEGSNDIAVLKFADQSLSRIRSGGAGPGLLAMGPEGRYLYIYFPYDGKLLALDLAKERVVRTAMIGRNVAALTLSPDGNLLYAINSKEAVLMRIETASLVVSHRLKTHASPAAMTLDAEKGTLWVACRSGSVLVYQDQLLRAENTPEPKPEPPIVIVPPPYLQPNSGNSSPFPAPQRSRGLPVPVNPTPKPEPAIESVPSGVYSFHIIVGSFTTRENALKEARIWQSRGHHASVLPMTQGSFRVSAGKFSQREAASRATQDIRTRYNISAWILQL
ncbi:MAG: hypothetical protein EAZ89_19475 [Bacteroidetes bacterium]|nr:MAG: hypothetical protein EAZ89_19475 [Bacteroidota bacterium]